MNAIVCELIRYVYDVVYVHLLTGWIYYILLLGTYVYAFLCVTVCVYAWEENVGKYSN